DDSSPRPCGMEPSCSEPCDTGTSRVPASLLARGEPLELHNRRVSNTPQEELGSSWARARIVIAPAPFHEPRSMSEDGPLDAEEDPEPKIEGGTRDQARRRPVEPSARPRWHRPVEAERTTAACAGPEVEAPRPAATTGTGRASPAAAGRGRRGRRS